MASTRLKEEEFPVIWMSDPNALKTDYHHPLTEEPVFRSSTSRKTSVHLSTFTQLTLTLRVQVPCPSRKSQPFRKSRRNKVGGREQPCWRGCHGDGKGTSELTYKIVTNPPTTTTTYGRHLPQQPTTCTTCNTTTYRRHLRMTQGKGHTGTRLDRPHGMGTQLVFTQN